MRPKELPGGLCETPSRQCRNGLVHGQFTISPKPKTQLVQQNVVQDDGLRYSCPKT